MPVRGTNLSSRGRSGDMRGSGVLIGSTSPAPAPAPVPAPIPVATAPVSASAAYYYNPEEEARRFAAIQARVQASLAAERAANQARSQRRSRSGGGRSRGGSRDARTYASNSGMKYPEEPAITVRPQYDPEEYASNSGMTYPVRGPVSPAEAAYAAEDRMQPRYLGVSAGPAVSAYDQALTDNGGALEQGYTSVPPRQGYVSAPPNQTLTDYGSVPEQGYMSAPPDQAFTDYGGMVDQGYTPVPPAPAPYVAPDSALSDSQAMYARVGPQMPDGYTPAPEAPYRGLGFAQSGAPAYIPQYDPAFPPAPPAPPRVVTPEEAMAGAEGMMQPRYTGASSGLGALWSMVRSAVADALSGPDDDIRRW